MRKVLKILHTLAACGLIGGLIAYMILLIEARQDTAAAYADLRWSIAAISNYLLLPSLAVALLSGIFSMVVHRPYMEKSWALIKAALGILMFKGVLTIVGAKANYAAKVSERIANGEAPAGALDSALAYEWMALVTIMVLSIANVVLGVWRPKLKRRSSVRERRASASSPKADDAPIRGEPAQPAS